MPTFSRPAVEITQGNLTLYLTYVTPEDLFTHDFYTVDKLEPQLRDGYQRILDNRRAGRLAKHLHEAYDEGYAHLPTTILLATSQSLEYIADSKTLEFELDDVCPFSVVDGQHRIEGLRLAVERGDELRDFQLPVTIATGLDDTHQMYHFFIVNTTQVPVDAGLRQQITRRFTDMQGVADLPYIPHWLKREVHMGRDARALGMIEYLNEESDSPIYHKIQMANDPVGRNKIKQASIVNMFKSEVFVATNPLAIQESDPQRQNRIMLNYMRSIDNLFVDGRDRDQTVVYKSSGLFLFVGISKWVFNAVYSSTRDFTINSMTQVISDACDEMNDAYRDMMNPDWWMPGPLGASSLNRAAARRYIEEFQSALSRAQQSSDIQL